MNPFWTFEANPDTTIPSLTTLLEKDYPTKGDFSKDLEFFSSTYHVIVCPNVQISHPNNFEVLRISNVLIDISSWRVILLALTTTGSKIRELVLHSCELSSTHICDLVSALNKFGSIYSLKIQFCDFKFSENNTQEYKNAFKMLFSESTSIEYLSLKGNNLFDELLSDIPLTLKENYRIKGINLASNHLTDETVSLFTNSIKLLNNLKVLSLANNLITGNSLLDFLRLTLGFTNNFTDDATLKQLLKQLNDKNKGIKDSNKKRKKSGYEELSELSTALEFTFTIDGKPIYANMYIETLDLTGNQISPNPIKEIVSNFDYSVVDSKLQIFLNKISLDDIPSQFQKYFITDKL